MNEIRENGACAAGGIQILTIIGQIEGHQLLPEDTKTTKYEHVMPLLAAAEESPEVAGLLVLVNTVRFTIQGMGFSVFAITSGVLEMIARSLAGLVVVPLIGYTGICLAHPMAWIFADAFLIPAFFYCKKKIVGLYK